MRYCGASPPSTRPRPLPPLTRLVPLDPLLATPIEPWRGDAHPIARAQWALATREWKLALRLLDEALLTDDADPAPLWVARARVLCELGEPERALNHLNNALDARPAHHVWRLLRGDVHLELGNASSALEDYRRALYDSGRSMPRVELLVATLKRQQGELEDQ